MNIFKTVPALLKVLGSCKKYNKNIPEFKRLRESGDVKAEQALILKESGLWAENTSKILGLNYEIIGEENIPAEGPIFVYSNHQSAADILAIYYLFRNHFQIGFISKDEWRKLGPLAKAIEYTRSLFLVRDNSREALKLIGEAKALLEQGFSLAIFPEGTRSKRHEMSDFKTASFKFAEKGNVPILPITLDGGYKAFEETGSFVSGQTIKITVHPLVHIEEMDKAHKKEAYAKIEETIRNGLDK